MNLPLTIMTATAAIALRARRPKIAFASATHS